MSKNNSGPHVKLTAPHVEEKARIDCLVSREVKEMWEEIVAKDREISKQRYYPCPYIRTNDSSRLSNNENIWCSRKKEEKVSDKRFMKIQKLFALVLAAFQ